MDCKEFRERLDLYVDGELSATAADEAREHSKGCAPCAKFEARLRLLRRSLKRAVGQHHSPLGLEREVLRSLRPRGRTHGRGESPRDEGRRARAPLWRAQVVVPAPFFALLVLSLVALAGWLLFARGMAREQVSKKQPASFASPAPPGEASGGLDLSRYFNGERASLRVVRRAGPDGSGR